MLTCQMQQILCAKKFDGRVLYGRKHEKAAAGCVVTFILNENKSQCPKGLGFFLLYLGLQVDTYL